MRMAAARSATARGEVKGTPKPLWLTLPAVL